MYKDRRYRLTFVHLAAIPPPYTHFNFLESFLGEEFNDFFSFSDFTFFLFISSSTAFL